MRKKGRKDTLAEPIRAGHTFPAESLTKPPARDTYKLGLTRFSIVRINQKSSQMPGTLHAPRAGRSARRASAYKTTAGRDLVILAAIPTTIFFRECSADPIVELESSRVQVSYEIREGNRAVPKLRHARLARAEGQDEREENSGGVIDAAGITAMIGMPGNRSTIPPPSSPRDARDGRDPRSPLPRQDIENYPGTMAYTRSRIAIRSRLLLIYAHNTH